MRETERSGSSPPTGTLADASILYNLLYGTGIYQVLYRYRTAPGTVWYVEETEKGISGAAHPASSMPPDDRRSVASTWLSSAGMGAAAGATSKTVVAPVERIRLLLQMRSSVGTRSGLRAVLQQEGVAGLWRGNGLSVARATMQKGILFSTQDSLRGALGSDTAAGGMAGLVAGGLTYPLDLLRTRHAGQVGAQPILAVARESIAKHGIHALWSGASATLAGGVVFEAARFGIFGQLMELKQPDGETKLGPASAGAIASMVAGNAIYPNDTIRRRLQTVSGSGESYLQVRHRRRPRVLFTCVMRVYSSAGDIHALRQHPRTAECDLRAYRMRAARIPVIHCHCLWCATGHARSLQ